MNNLKRDSIVKTDEVYILSMNQIAYKIGSISKELVEEYKNSYSQIKSKQLKSLKDRQEPYHELKKGIDSISNGKTYPSNEVFEEVYNELESNRKE